MDHIASVFASVGDAQTMGSFLAEILTPAERSTLALRWKLLKMLHKQIPQRRIADELGVSLCKITRGSKILKQPGSVSRRLLSVE
jgi:TrpR family transcriptional regulator, trp operon repressor